MPAQPGAKSTAQPAAEPTIEPADRAALRSWLAAHHQQPGAVWLLYAGPSAKTGLSYLDLVEECLCFGWVDGLARRFDEQRIGQRISPRRPKSNWTELNKERARRLIASGQMTEAGVRVLPELDPSRFVVPPDIQAALASDAETWRHFQSFPALYRRVRVGYVDERRRQPAEFQRSLANLLAKTREGKLFGNWDDSGLRRTGGTPPVGDPSIDDSPIGDTLAGDSHRGDVVGAGQQESEPATGGEGACATTGRSRARTARNALSRNALGRKR